MTVSAGDDFMLTWMYSNNKLMFTMKCKTTGWCAVAFTTGDGSGMKDYDIALGGVASGTNYLDVSGMDFIQYKELSFFIASHWRQMGQCIE